MALLAVFNTAAHASAAYDLTGEWATGYENSEGARETKNGDYKITSMNMSTGAFSGTALVLGTSFQLEGVENGSTADYTLTEGGYTAYDTLHLEREGNGHIGGSGTFNSSGYSESGSRFWAEQTEGKRPSKTEVVCNYETASADFNCDAIVGDASGEPPLDEPTGSVTFTATSGGFLSESCTLMEIAGSPGVAECSVVYRPPSGGIPAGTPPPVTAHYAGNTELAGSEGADKALSKPPNSGESEEQERRKSEEEKKKGEEAEKKKAAEKEEALQKTAEKIEEAALQEFEKGWPEENWSSLGGCPAAKAAASESGGLLSGGGAGAASLASAAAWQQLGLAAAPPLRSAYIAAAMPSRVRRAHPLDFARARARALQILRPRRQPTLDELAVIAARKALKAGTQLGEYRLTSGKAPKAVRLRESAWVFWENTELLGQFPHANALIAISVHTGRLLYARAEQGAPTVNGSVPAWVLRGGGGHAVYKRSGRAALPKKTWAPVLEAEAFARRLLHPSTAKKADRARAAGTEPAPETPAAPPLNPAYKNSRVIVLGGGSVVQRGETFNQERDAVQDVFAQHGVQVYNPIGAPLDAELTPLTSPGVYASTPSLGTIVRDAHEEDGVNQITIYATGHGSVNMSGGVVKDAMVTIDNEVGGRDYLRASTLAAIATANPGVQFNIVIDACHSGAFIDVLKGIPNVTSVNTSSAANEISYSPGTVEPYDPAKVPDQRNLSFNPGFQPMQGQLILNSEKPLEGGISPFTTAEVKAINQAFTSSETHATPEPVSAVVQRAGKIEPLYDEAAQLGETHPSEDYSTPCNQVSNENGTSEA